MATYILKAWDCDDLIVDTVLEAADDVSAIKAAENYPLPLGIGAATKAELRNNLSLPIWKLPPGV